MNQLSGINEPDLGTLSIEILDYADKVSEIFEKIDSEIFSLTNYYKGTSSNKIIEAYDGFRKNYQTIKENIISYSDDLNSLLTHSKDNEKYFASLFTNLSLETNANNNMKNL